MRRTGRPLGGVAAGQAGLVPRSVRLAMHQGLRDLAALLKVQSARAEDPTARSRPLAFRACRWNRFQEYAALQISRVFELTAAPYFIRFLGCFAIAKFGPFVAFSRHCKTKKARQKRASRLLLG